MIPHIRTNNGIIITLGGIPVTVSSTDQRYGAVLGALNGTEDDMRKALNEHKERIIAAVGGVYGMKYENGAITYRGRQLISYDIHKLVSLIDDNQNIEPLARFVAHKLNNPSSQVIQHLYAFLEKGNMPLTENGCFLAYKGVRDDYRDHHSGSMNNAPGQVVSMKRNEVDDRRDVTCSHGLHVCTYDYIKHYFNYGRIVVCEVNPADVVAVPSDYDDSKMRVCQYRVLKDITEEARKNNILSSREVFYDDVLGISDHFKFKVQVAAPFGNYVDYASDLEDDEAEDKADELIEFYSKVRVVNMNTGDVTYELS